MIVDDITVEVRNASLIKQGQITPTYLDIQFNKPLRSVGEWKLVLPRDHPMVPILATPGSGIVISMRTSDTTWTEYLTGPTDDPTEVINQTNPDGTYTFHGVSDTILLADALAFPDPATGDPTAQTLANDVRSGNAETIMRAYVKANIAGAEAGPPPAARLAGLRNFLKLSANAGRGPATQKSPRFQNMLELMQEIGVFANLGFQIIQRGQWLYFEVLTLTDRSALIRLDIANGTITSQTIKKSPPRLTRAIVAGQGEGVLRQFVYRTTPASVAAEASWGRVIEQFVDQRNTNVTAELQQAGDEELLNGGFASTSVKVIPSDDQTMRVIRDWDVGDTIGLVILDQATSSIVTEAVFIANSSRVVAGVSVGDISKFDVNASQAAKNEDTTRRVDSLERSVEIDNTPVTWTEVTGKPASFPPDPASTTYDSRYYTETEMNAGQMDSRYYTETELNAGQLDSRYYTETEIAAFRLADQNRVGWVPIIPSGVVKTGSGTVTVGAKGRVTISAGATLTQLIIQGVFSSNFRRYMLVFRLQAADYIHMRLASGSTPYTGALYQWQGFYAQAGTLYYGASYFGQNVSSIRFVGGTGGYAGGTITAMITNPFETTQASVDGHGGWGGATPTTAIMHGEVGVTTSYDALVLLPASGNITEGEIEIYGLSA